jgi:hypothetical protein
MEGVKGKADFHLSCLPLPSVPCLFHFREGDFRVLLRIKTSIKTKLKMTVQKICLVFTKLMILG